MKPREEALADLLVYQQPIEQLVQTLRQFPWDAETPLVIVTPQHIRHACERYLQGTLSAQALEDWANAIECREDIGFLPPHEASLERAIHQLANPLLTESVTPESVTRLLEKLTHTAR